MKVAYLGATRVDGHVRWVVTEQREDAVIASEQAIDHFVIKLTGSVESAYIEVLDALMKRRWSIEKEEAKELVAALRENLD